MRAFCKNIRPLYKKQILVMAIGVIAPFIAFILYLAGLSPVPIAHSVILQRIPVGVMVVDDQERVTEVNPAAEAVLGLAPGEGIGRPAALLTDQFLELSEILRQSRPGVKEEVRHGDQHFTFEVVNLKDKGDLPRGSVLLIRDISPWRQAEDALLRRTNELEVVNRQLALISAITRHDISNQLVMIGGYLDLLLEDRLTPAQAGVVEQVFNATGRVGQMVTFMRDYQAIGTSTPVWTDLRHLTEQAAAEVALGNVQIENLLPAIEVLADPLIEKVIATLFENAIRHGETVTRIQISTTTDQAGLMIVYEDDGVGVKEDKKERIFERGYGSNTGLGLFLAREILAITGMTIAETGIPGVGARFEIRIPSERYRTRS